MGTALPPGLITASKAPAPGGTDKAFKRINDLVDGKRFAGFYYETGDKVRTLYIPKIVTLEVTSHPDGTDPSEGETWEGFLGQGSNATARAMFDLISTDICKCALVMSDGSIPVPPCFAAGDPFTTADVEATCPNLAPLLPTGFTTYRLVSSPSASPSITGSFRSARAESTKATVTPSSPMLRGRAFGSKPAPVGPSPPKRLPSSTPR